MKFYFCEACGRRLTEHDIEKGAARDKALKGVFCAICAEGVTTLDTMPVSNAEARTLIEKEKTPRKRTTGQAVRPTGMRGSGNQRSPSPKDLRSRDSRRIAEVPASRSWIWILSGAGLALALVVIIATLSSGNAGAPVRTAKLEKPRGPQDGPEDATEPATDTHPGEPSEPRSGVGKPQPKTVEPKPPVEAPGDAVPTDDPAALVDAEPRPKPEEQVEAPEPSPPTKADSPPGPAQSAKPEVKPEPPKPERVFDEAYVKRVLAPLGKGDWATSAQLAADAPENVIPELKAALEKLAADLHSREKALLASLAPKKGQNLTVKTRGGVVSGKLTRINEDELWIEKPFMINGRVQGYSQEKVKLRDLAHETIAKWTPKKPPATKDDWVREVLRSMAHANLDEARRGFNELAGHVLEKPLRRFLTREQGALNERQAAAQWGVLLGRSETRLSKRAAKAWLEDFAAFEKQFASTAFVSGKAGRRKRAGIREHVWFQAAGLDSRVISLFRGKVLNYDPETRRLRVEYDFSHARQMGDFEGTKWGTHGRYYSKIEKGNLCGYSDINRKVFPILCTDRFIASGLALEMDLNFLNRNTDKHRFAGRYYFRFSSPASRGKSSPISLHFNGGAQVLWLDVPENQGATSKSFMIPDKGKWRFSVRGGRCKAIREGKTVLDCAAPAGYDHTGFTLYAMNDGRFEISRLCIEGQLNPFWLKDALMRQDTKKR